MDIKETDRIEQRILDILNREMPEYTFEARGGSYTSLDCTLKINAAPKEDDNVRFKKQLSALGMIDLDLTFGQIVEDGLKKYRIVAIEHTRKRYPIVAENLNSPTKKKILLAPEYIYKLTH